MPVFAQLSIWGVRRLPVAEECAARTEVLATGGPPTWEAFMDELRDNLGPQAQIGRAHV